ncbi:clan AA aspartic protease [Marichromatium purpuratum 984]|uniref:Clan AA aspartic protease n=1 Tax=Marichromatium purpuratum 984 TaxID=765910 RepID=W0DW82_MARPU|nr:retropepsin-like aspartic protease [Marichromatium purpuratum]AHF02682.1 clan AA aspartic protease [Marichromatium purpuratum 984]
MKAFPRITAMTRGLRRHQAPLLLMFLMLTLMVGVRLGSPQNPNPRPVAYLGSDGVPEVRLVPNALDQFIVTGSINGESTPFLVDTGAVDVAMSYAVAQRLGLELRSGGYSKTGNGNVASWTARLDSVDVGGLTVRDVKATVLPNLHGDEVLLGMAYLKHMELVLRGGVMTLRPFVAEG